MKPTIVATLLLGIGWMFLPGTTLKTTNDQLHKTACSIFFPTAFSPNGDGVNDVFQAKPASGCLFAEATLRIFDRWGNLVFESTQPESGWDGRFRGQPANQGVYLYQFQYSLSEAETITPQQLEGEVILVR